MSPAVFPKSNRNPSFNRANCSRVGFRFHPVRASLQYVNWKQRKEVAGGLRLIYQSSKAAEALTKRDEFSRKWDAACPMVSQI
jgi:transposase-like protein